MSFNLVEAPNIKKLDEMIESGILDKEDKVKFEKYKKKLGSDGMVSINYERKNEKTGRFYAEYPSLEYFSGSQRDYLLEGICEDWDIVNTHPTLLLQIMKKNNVSCKELEDYVEDRSKFLNEEKKTKEEISLCINNKNYRSNSIRYTRINKCVYNTLYRILINHERYKYIYEYCLRNKKDRKIIENTFISYVLQTEESFIAETIMDYLHDEGISICFYLYDGFYLYINEKLNDSLKEKITEIVKEKNDFTIQIKKKELDSSEIIEKLKKRKSEYEAWKEKWELTHVYDCSNSEKPYYSMYKDSDVSKLKPFEKDKLNHRFDSEIGIYKFYSKILEEKELQNLERWLSDINILKCTKIDMCPTPDKPHSSTFNTWKGFELERLEIPDEITDFNKLKETEVVKTFHEFITHLCSKDSAIIKCTGNDNPVDYVIQWFANIVQFPSRKSQVAPVINGDQGTGKGTFGHYLRGILGEHFLKVENLETVTQQFNSTIVGKLCIFYDECVSTDMFEHNNRLKNLITEDTFLVEYKGISTKKQYTNYLLHVFVSNDTCNIVVKQSERRFMVLNPDVMSVELQAKIYQNGKFKFDDSEMKLLFNYLKMYPITITDFQRQRPMTEAYKEIQEYQFESKYIWLYAFSKYYNKKKITNKGIFEEYTSYMEMTKSKFPLGSRQLSLFLNKISKIDGLIENKKTDDNRYKVFDHEKISKYLKDKKLYIPIKTGPNEDDVQDDYEFIDCCAKEITVVEEE